MTLLRECFSFYLVVHVLALSGPAYILCPLLVCVKDSLVYNCAKLLLRVLYKGHAFFKMLSVAN